MPDSRTVVLPDDHLPLSQGEKRLIEDWREQGLKFVSEYMPSHSSPPSLADLDTSHQRWRMQPIETRPHANDVLNGLSILLADHLFEDSPCRWVVIDDNLGARLAVFHEGSGWSVNVRDVFAKRMLLEEPWIESFFHTIKTDLAGKQRSS